MREQFTFYRSFYESIASLRKKEDRLSIFEAICSYALNEEVKPMTDAANALFILIKPNLDSAARKSKGGKKATSKEEDTDKISGRYREDVGKEKENKKENKKEIENECYKENKKESNPRFKPPTLDEVTAYVEERGSGVDPRKFFEYFDVGGWKDAKGNAVKNWKQKLLTWEKFNGNASKPKEKTFADMYREMKENEAC